MKGIPRESCLQARQQLGQKLWRQLVAKTRDELQSLSEPCRLSNTFLSGISIISRCHTLTALGFIISVLPIGGAHAVLFPAFSSMSLAAAMFNDPPPPASSTQ
ncbi:uncharacterized protein V6R79_024839 [Siganus canaliculatus]